MYSSYFYIFNVRIPGKGNASLAEQPFYRSDRKNAYRAVRPALYMNIPLVSFRMKAHGKGPGIPGIQFFHPSADILLYLAQCPGILYEAVLKAQDVFLKLVPLTVHSLVSLYMVYEIHGGLFECRLKIVLLVLTVRPRCPQGPSWLPAGARGWPVPAVWHRACPNACNNH